MLAFTGALLFSATASAQSPNEDASRRMEVAALAPVPAGADIRIEALDPETLTSVVCGRASSSADEKSSSSSRVSLSVDDSCVKGNSGNLRICWADNQCQVFQFKAGETVDLGELTTEKVEGIPQAGLTNHVEDSALGGWAARLRLLGYATLLLGFGGLLIAGHAFVRKHRNQPVQG